MSDQDNQGDGGITGALAAWAIRAYEIAKWSATEAVSHLPGTGSATPSAMATLQDRLTPRPATTLPPAGATAPEIKGINDAYLALTTHIADNIDSSDTASARQQLKDLMQLIATAQQAAEARSQLDAKRQVLERELKKIPYSAAFTPEEMRDFAKRRSQLAADLSAAVDVAQMPALETVYETLRDDVAAAQAKVQPRADAATEIAAAEAARAALGKTVDRGYYLALVTAIDTADHALSNATTLQQIVTLRADLARVMAKQADAIAYAEDFDRWCLNAEGYLQVYAPDPSKDARSDARELRNTLAKEAAKHAATLDFTAARAELAKFETNALVTGTGDFTACAAFMAQLDTFIKTHNDKRQTVKQSKMTCANYMDTHFADIRKQAIVSKDWAAAGVRLTAFQTKIDTLYPLALKLREVLELKTSLNDTDPPLDAMIGARDAANGEIDASGGGNVATALGHFSGIGGATRDAVEGFKRLGVITTRVAAVRTAGRAATAAHITGQLPAIKLAISADLGAANASMTTLEALLDDIEAWMPVIAEADAQQKLVDDADSFTLLAGARADATGHAYNTAKTKAEAALQGYAALAEYLKLEKQMTLVQGAQVPASAPLVAITTALTEADDLARTQGKIADAVTRLRQMFSDTALAETIHEAGLWAAQLDAIQKRHDDIIARMSPDAAKTTMNTAFDAAKAKAATDHDYPAATKLLEDYAQKLTEARDYSAARDRVGRVKATLDRTVAQFSTVPDVKQQVYGAADDSQMLSDIAKAEALATAGKVKEAGVAFDALLTAWKPLLRATALMLEARDATGTNAGHSIDRHGAQISDEDLLARLTTGVAPDDKTSTTRASSKFETFAAWLEAREEGAKLVESKVHPSTGAAVSVDDTSIPASADAFVRMDDEIDHHGPIDKAFVGIKPNQQVDAGRGKIGKGSTYETYEELSGITKSKTLWLFEIDPAALAPVLEPPFGTGTEKWKRTPAEYIRLYGTVTPALPPLTEIPGKWVMMQLFPLVAGWDQEQQAYKT